MKDLVIWIERQEIIWEEGRRFWWMSNFGQ